MAHVRIALQNMLIDKLIDESDASVVQKLEQNVRISKKFLAAEDIASAESCAFPTFPRDSVRRGQEAIASREF